MWSDVHFRAVLRRLSVWAIVFGAQRSRVGHRRGTKHTGRDQVQRLGGGGRLFVAAFGAPLAGLGGCSAGATPHALRRSGAATRARGDDRHGHFGQPHAAFLAEQALGLHISAIPAGHRPGRSRRSHPIVSSAVVNQLYVATGQAIIVDFDGPNALDVAYSGGTVKTYPILPTTITDSAPPAFRL